MQQKPSAGWTCRTSVVEAALTSPALVAIQRRRSSQAGAHVFARDTGGACGTFSYGGYSGEKTGETAEACCAPGGSEA